MNTGRARARRRRGYAVVEVAMAVAVLMTAMVVALKLVAWLGSERRALERREFAQQEVANVLEQLMASPFEAVTREHALELAGKSPAKRRLPGAEWSASVDDANDSGINGRRITLSLRWKTRHGQWDAPARFQCWRFRGGRS